MNMIGSASVIEVLFSQWMIAMAWQVAVLVIVLFVVTRCCLPRASARLKYGLWMLVPIRLVLPPTLALATGWGWWLLPEQQADRSLISVAQAGQNQAAFDFNMAVAPDKLNDPDKLSDSNLAGRRGGLSESRWTAGNESFLKTHGERHFPLGSDEFGLSAVNFSGDDRESIAGTALADQSPADGVAMVLGGVADQQFSSEGRASAAGSAARGAGPRHFSWILLAMAAWIFGVLVLLARLLIAQFRLAKIVRESVPASAIIQSTLERCCQMAGVRQRVDIRHSKRISGPVLAGLLRPVILVTESFEKALKPDEQAAIIVHELQHVRRRDLWNHHVESLLRAVYWFHPAVWLAARETRRLREMACDEATVAALGGRRRDYGLGMVKIAESMIEPGPALSLPMLASKTDLSSRIQSILDPRLAVGQRLSLPALATLLIAALVLLPSAGRSCNTGAGVADSAAVASVTDSEQPDNSSIDQLLEPTISNETAGMRDSDAGIQDEKQTQDDAKSQDELPKLRVRVIDEAGEPIAGARVYSSTWTRHPEYQKKPNVERFTDETGSCDVELYPELYILRIWFGTDGYVGLFINWEEEETDRIPEEFIVTLQRGTRLGGIVTDQNGNPVADAKIEVSLDEGGIKIDSNPETELNTWLATGKDAAVTDENGRWNIDTAPAGDDLKLRLIVHHPDYNCDNNWQPLEKFGLELDSLRSGTAKISLKPGIIVSGRVIDSENQPVEGAVIVWGDRPYMEQGSQETKTLEDGSFRLPARSSGPIRLTVVAKGWMPQTKLIDVTEQIEPLEFRVEPGKKLIIKVVDHQGQPIPNADFRLDSWRGSEALYNIRHSNVLPTGVPDRANEDGVYVWDWAPDDEVKFSVNHIVDREVVASKTLELTATDEEQTLVLPLKFVLSGTVVDATSGEPINDYRITPITYWARLANARGISQSSWTKRFDSNSFRFPGDGFGDNVENAFRFEAAGYQVFTTPRFDLESPPTSVEIRLVPSETNMGQILDSTDRPVAGAGIVVAVPDGSVIISRHSDYLRDASIWCQSDHEGRFALPTYTNPFAVVIGTAKGYAEKYCQPGESVGQLQLQPWAKVEGTLYQDGKPVPNAKIFLSPIRELGGSNPHVQDEFWETTDLNGRFAFKTVPPVPSSISAYLSSWEDFPITSSRIIPLDLQPGETHQVNLGGDGLLVHGQVKLNGDLADKIEFRYGIHTLVRTDGGQVEVPEHAKKGIEWQAGEQLEYQRKLAGGSNLDGMEHHTVKLNPDGSFFINGVQPGHYRFLLQIYEPPSGCLVDPVGYGFLEFNTNDFVVSDNRLDLGTIEIDLKQAPQVGDVLPDISWKTLDNQTQRLSELRGQYVLIDCWATWCAPCIAAFPDVARLHRELGGPKLEVVGLCIDADTEAAQAMAREKRLSWTQGFVGDQSESPAGRILGVSSVPLYILLDPDGKILLRTSNLAELEQVLKDVLQE